MKVSLPPINQMLSDNPEKKGMYSVEKSAVARKDSNNFAFDRTTTRRTLFARSFT
jgi:hypothetical protein